MVHETEQSERLRRFRVWGTVMVGLCFLIGIVAYGGGRYCFGVFIKPMSEALDWSRTQISLGATINLIVYGLASPFVGRLQDRVGIKVSVVAGAAIVGLSLCLMYFCSSLWVFYLLFGAAAAVGVNMAGRITQATIVTNWFIRQRGLMFGVTAFSIGLGTTIIAPAANAVLERMGWRSAFLFLGSLFFLVILVPAVFLIKGKGRPEDRGFGPDGSPLTAGPEARNRNQAAQAGGNPSRDWTLREAFGTSAFWGILIAMGLSYMADYIVLFHGIPCFQDRGLTPASAASVIALGSLVSCAGRVGFGWLADRIDTRACIVLMLVLQIAASPFLIFGGGSESLLYAFAVIWGIGYGGLAPLMPAVSSDYFGRANFGAIFGWVTMATVIGGAVGSTLGGWIYDLAGNYDPAWWGTVAMRAVACVIVFAMAGRPVKRVEPEGIVP